MTGIQDTASFAEPHSTPPPTAAAREREQAGESLVDAPPVVSNAGGGLVGLFIRVFSSFGLSVVLLLFLGLLTFFGTLAQGEIGLYRTIQHYFASIFLIEWIGGRFPLPLPGGYLVMSLLTINLFVGGIVRMRKDLRRAGILITHFGIALLFLSGLVKDLTVEEGSLALHEGERAAFFHDHYQWEVAITQRLPSGEWKEHLIPGAHFEDLRGPKARTFETKELPFSITLSHFLPNAMPTTALDSPSLAVAADGVGLEPRPLAKDPEVHLAGLHATLHDRNGEGPTEREAVLFGWHGNLPGTTWRPLRHESGGTTFAIELRRRLWTMPYEVELVDFRRELYPGTGMAKSFDSDVLVRDRHSKTPEKVHIWMNHPLRRDGYVTYQTSWGPQNNQPGPMYSIFTIVKNPSDKWPEIACYIIAFGLCLHYGVMLTRFVNKETRRSAS